VSCTPPRSPACLPYTIVSITSKLHRPHTVAILFSSKDRSPIALHPPAALPIAASCWSPRVLTTSRGQSCTSERLHTTESYSPLLGPREHSTLSHSPLSTTPPPSTGDRICLSHASLREPPFQTTSGSPSLPHLLARAALVTRTSTTRQEGGYGTLGDHGRPLWLVALGGRSTAHVARPALEPQGLLHAQACKIRQRRRRKMIREALGGRDIPRKLLIISRRPTLRCVYIRQELTSEDLSADFPLDGHALKGPEPRVDLLPVRIHSQRACGPSTGSTS
jgi:hypothetical protein